MTQNPKTSLKETNIPWIGKVPEDWDIVKIRKFFTLNKNQITKELLNGKFVYHYSIPSIQEFGEAKLEDGNEIDSNKFILNGNEILISKLNPRKGTIVISKKHEKLSVASTEFVTLTPKDIDTRYGYYLLGCQGVTNFLAGIVQSSTYSHQRVNPDDIYKLWVAIPKINTQTTIANFLDQKTTEIKKFIENKRKLIELLREQKQSIIHRAVTKGIDPDAKMKDSGIPWIGEIPEDWEVKRLKYETETRVSNVDKKSEDEIEVQLCNYVDVYKNDFIDEDIDFMNATATEQQISRFRLKEGDVIITKDSETADDIGVPAYVKLKNNINVVCGYHLAICSPNEAVLLGQFLFRLFQSKFFQSYFEVNCNGVTRFGLDIYSIINAIILLPPLSIQKPIIKHIEKETSQIDSAISKIEKEINLIEEYKTSLIYQAVTGKIQIP